MGLGQGRSFDKLRTNGFCWVTDLPTMTETERIIEGVLTGPAARLDKALAEASGLSRERVKALLGEGRVLVDGQPAAQASAKLRN